MPKYEYKVVPAPTKGVKAPGVKGAEARFSHTIQDLMNKLATEGWEYQRAETLPSVERSGLTGSTTEWRNILVFRRLRDDDAEAFSPELLPPPQEPATPVAAPALQRQEPAVRAPEKAAVRAVPPAPKVPAPAAKPDPAPVARSSQRADDADGIATTLQKFASTRNAAKSDT